MKKTLFNILAAALLVFGLTGLSHADTNRTTRIIKICTYPVASNTVDAVLLQADGTAYCNLDNVEVDRISMFYNLTVTGGSGVVLKAITEADPTNIAGATTDTPLKGQDSSNTAFVSATITSTPRGGVGLNVTPAGATALGVNLGRGVGVWADTTSSTYLGTVWLIVWGK